MLKKMNAPKPAPEVAKLDYFVGHWAVEGTIFPGPWGGGGKFGWTEKSQWMPGNFFVVGHWDFTMPAELGGDGEELFVMGYDTHACIYTFDAFSSHGLHQVSRGNLDADTWVWDSQGIQGGVEVKQKMTMEMLSATRYILRFEIANGGVIWTPFLEGHAIKQEIHP
jgi:hypothetical protein